MNKILNNAKELVVRKRGISLYFMAATFVCALVTLIVYGMTGVTVFNPELSGAVTALYVVILVFSALLCVVEIKLGKYAVYAVSLLVWMIYIGTQVNYLANLIASIDGSTVSAGFVMTIAFGALTWITALVSAILQRYELVSRKPDIKESHAGSGVSAENGTEGYNE